MARPPEPGSAEMTASSVESPAAAEMRPTKTRTATMEGTTSAAKMRATTATAAHMNAAAMSSAATTGARVGRYSHGGQDSKCHKGDFKKVSHGFTPRVKIIVCKHINVESS